jgi:metallo-beta-lactamase family protein
MRITLYGAAGEVTGSCTLVEAARARVLVDFGLHQGGPSAERANRRRPPIDFGRLDSILLTHAHLDHSGRLPQLAQWSYDRPIWATPATIELCHVMLRDSANIQESDAQRCLERRKRAGRSTCLPPLYTAEDTERVLRLFRPLAYGTPTEIAPGVTVTLADAGHILGSASARVRMEGDAHGNGERTIQFSGDLGPHGLPILRDPDLPNPLGPADLLVLESTYGDRDHRSADGTIEELVRILGEARARNSRVLIPAFAVGRTQQLISIIGDLVRANRIAPVPVVVDSPLGNRATALYRAHPEVFDDHAHAALDAGHHPLDFGGLRHTQTSDESRQLNKAGGGTVIIAGAGMCTGGRILHHLRHGLWDPAVQVVFVGFQAEGSLGRRIVDGAKQVRIMNEPIAVKAQIHTLGGFSAHAGQGELLAWAGPALAGGGGGVTDRPRVALNHGEDRPREVLAGKLQERFTPRQVHMPTFGTSIEL